MTDHLTEARDKVDEKRDELLIRGADPGDVAYLIMAVRHLVAEEIRHTVETYPFITRDAAVALNTESAVIDSFRLNVATGQWVIK